VAIFFGVVTINNFSPPTGEEEKMKIKVTIVLFAIAATLVVGCTIKPVVKVMPEIYNGRGDYIAMYTCTDGYMLMNCPEVVGSYEDVYDNFKNALDDAEFKVIDLHGHSEPILQSATNVISIEHKVINRNERWVYFTVKANGGFYRSLRQLEYFPECGALQTWEDFYRDTLGQFYRCINGEGTCDGIEVPYPFVAGSKKAPVTDEMREKRKWCEKKQAEAKAKAKNKPEPKKAFNLQLSGGIS
jgi:hypothetical protein